MTTCDFIWRVAALWPGVSLMEDGIVGRALLVLNGSVERSKAAHWVSKAPAGTRVMFQGPKRSLDQNSAMWRLLTKVAEQHLHFGQKLTPDDYRLIFLDALKREVRMVPALDGRGFVNLGRSSSDLSKEEFSDLLELITAWCAQNGIDIDDSSEGPDRANNPAGAAA